MCNHLNWNKCSCVNTTSYKMSTTWWNVLILLVITLLKDTGATKPRGIHSTLTETLLSGYGPTSARPVLNVTKRIDVEIDLEIVRVIELNERYQTLQQSAFLGLHWHDDYLAWNASEYPDVEVLIVDADQIWRPDIHLYENVDRNFESVKDFSAWVYPNGNVSWVAPVVLYTACRIDARLFPFDTQYCTLRFGSWSYDLKHLNIYPKNLTSEQAGQYFFENGVWHLQEILIDVKIYDNPQGHFPEVVYTILLQRRPLFHVFNFVLPCGLLSLLNLMTFVLPTQSGEKVSLGITNLLALVLFQQLISDSLPPSAIDMPIISYYFTPMILIGCLSIVDGVLVAVLYHQYKSKPVPKWLLFVTQVDPMTRRKFPISQPNVNDQETELADSPSSKTARNNTSNGREIATIASPIEEQQYAIPKTKSCDPADYTSDWRRVAAVVDHYFLALGLLVTIASVTMTVVLFLTSNEGNETGI